MEAAVATPAAAPVAAPAPAAAPVVTTPAAPATPAAQPVTPAAEPAKPADGAAAAAPAAGAKVEPKASDFNDPEEFLKAHFAWRKETGAEDATVEDVTGDQPKVGEEKKEGDQPKVEDEPADSLTPESLKTLSDANPELNALFEAKPAIKGAFYQMARENAQAKPMLELFPTVNSAKFAADTANRTVALRQAVMLGAEDPAQMGNAFGMFLDEFTVKGADGKPVLDARGQPQLAEDFDPFVGHMLDNYFDGELGDVNDRLKADKYGSVKEKDADEAFVEAVKFIKAFKSSSPAQRMRPDLANLTDEQRAYFDQLEKENGVKRDELDKQGRDAKQTARVEARKTHETKFKSTFGGNIGKRLTTILDEKMKAGAYIPSYVLETLDPTTKISVFAKTVFDKFNTKINGIAEVRSKLAELQMQPPSEQALNSRVEFTNKLIDEFLPPVIDAELRLVRGKERSDNQRRGQSAEAARAAVEPEPKGGRTPTAQVLSDEQAYTKALEIVDQRHKGQFLDQGQRMEKALIEKDRLLRGGN